MSNNFFLWKNKSLKKLIFGLKKKGGRNNTGKIMNFRKSKPHTRLYRKIDFCRISFLSIKGVVRRLDYDPNRNNNICLVCYKNGYLAYHLMIEGLKINDIILTSKDNILIKKGNRLLLKYIPSGTLISSINTNNKNLNKVNLCRAAGTAALLLNKLDNINKVIIKLNSKIKYIINNQCFATIGQNSNINYKFIKLKKAGQNRWKGIKNTVRGVAMNPVDHPHGGGEGKKSPKVAHLSPWGKITKGKLTRKKKKWSNNFIIKKIK